MRRVFASLHVDNVHTFSASESAQKRQSGSESNNDSDNEVVSPRKKKYKKQVKKDKDALPDWTKNPDAIVFVIHIPDTHSPS